MAIEKGLYAAPEGLEEEQGEGLEIEIVDPEMVTLDDGSMEITIVPDANIGDMTAFDANLADFLEENQLALMAGDLIGMVESDKDARKEWADTFVEGLDLLGLKIEERAQPFQGACGVFSTVLSEAAIRFQAEAMSETFPAAGPVRTKVIGEEDKDTLEAADRVKADMNYELTEKMVEYRSEHERLLYSLGLSGSAFKKVYFDPNLGRQVAVYIPAEDVIVPYGASNIETAERVTHVMRKTKNELRKLQASGFYKEVDLGDPMPYHSDIEERKAKDSGYSITDDDRYSIYEIHADLVVDGIDSEEDIAKPYVVTIERGSNAVLAIRRNWNPDDDLQLKRQHFVHYVYVPGFGFYGLGLIHIVGGYAKAGTSIIRQLVDAGTLANLPGGLKSRGLRVKGDDTPIEPGEFKDVDVPSGSIKDNIMPLPYKEPSQTLLALLDKITNEGRRLGAISDMNISDMSANAPVGTTLALLERTLKPMAAVQSRVHYAMKQEFKLLKAIMAEYAPAEYGYQPNRGEVSARQSDYMMVDVIPVSDPNSSTMAQRVVQYQAVLQMAQSAPQIYNLPQLHRQMIEVLGIKNADKLVPTEDDAQPLDPISENMNALTGKPLKAFIYQDHAAHIAAHEAFMKDPMIAQMLGQNPQANRIMAALKAHIAEHYAFLYRQQIEEKLGVPLPPPNETLPPEIEVTMSQMMAKAGEKVTQMHIMQGQQAEAQQKAQDPIIQMQQQELQLKAQELQQKGQKDSVDMQLKVAEQKRKEREDTVDTVMDAKRLDLEEKELELEAKKAGVKLSLDAENAKSKIALDTAQMIKDIDRE
jgi:hypothetical protein|tara:strand:- start:1789 stop:4230 length:2442 start_codon:yes stop_codon:yes gene_type:complete